MNSEFDSIPQITFHAKGRSPGGELIFTFPEVIEVIKICTATRIAVLGVEIFLVTGAGYSALGSSDYDLRLSRKWPSVQPEQWNEYVRDNNDLAEQSVRENPAGDEHVYILTAASWAQFKESVHHRG